LSFVAIAALAAALQTPAVPAVHGFGALALTPQGDRIATIEGAGHGIVTFRDKTGKITGTADPCATCRYTDQAWSPDGMALAVTAADGKAGTVTLFVLEGGNVRNLTTVKGAMAEPRWSPDGKTLAVLAVPNARKAVGATAAGAKLVGEIGAAEAIDEQRIAVVPAAGGELTMVSPGDTWVYEYDWSADSKGFVATAAKGDGDNNWWTAKLQAFSLAGEERIIAAPKMQMNYPRVSADGKTVYFIGGLMSDFPVSGGDVFAAPVAGGEPLNLTPGYKGTFTSLIATKSGPVASVIIGGEVGIARIDPSKSKVEVLSKGEYSLAAADARFAVDASGKVAAAVSDSFTTAQRIEMGPLGAMKPITHDNDSIKPEFTAKSINWTNDGFSVQGWLLSPANVDPSKKYPMVTIVHGGPSSATTARFATTGTTYDLLKAGYFIFQPNPRGSYGQGEDFVLSNRRDFGGGDLRDILAGIDAIEKIAPVDDNRLGITGGSYGGFMTMWAVTHTDRFKAGAAGAGISNWISYYGQNGIDQWMIPFFGASAYDDPEIYDKLSPIRYIKNAKTPTFIYVGERDVETPAPQSLEFWHGLKAQGVDTTLMIYEGEGHGIRQPEHVKDLSKRVVGWFDKYLAK